MNKNVVAGVLIAFFFFIPELFGVTPQQWEIQSKEDFLKGKFEGISLSFDGVLSISPREESIDGPPEDFYLSFLLNSKGTIYLGTGHGGKIYRIKPGEKTELYFQVPEMDIYCMVQDGKGNLYAGTSPSGKIYKITGKGKGDVFFNPSEKYIWDLLFVEDGILLAAVGESGGIYEINQQGEGKLLFKAEENHILCLEKDEKGNIIAGSGGNGLVYKISPERRFSILFESPYEEIKSIALDGEGNIYASAGGISARNQKERVSFLTQKPETDFTITVTPSTTDTAKSRSSAWKQPGAIYKITSEGRAKKIWSSSEELVYTLLWNKRDNRLIFGTGPKGRIFSADKKGKISLLVQLNSEQVYLLRLLSSKIYILSNNPSHLGVVYPDQRFSGQYTSQVLDAKIFSSWGRISWEADLPRDTSLRFQTRTGNSREPNQAWSNWSPPYQKESGEKILNPQGRYIQFKAIFKSQSGRSSPHLRKVSLFYLQINVPPEITKLEFLPPNKVFLKPPETGEVFWGYEQPFSKTQKKEEKVKTYVVRKQIERKGFQTITWEASDENGDVLAYDLFIRKEGENKWRILKENWMDTVFTFDTLSFPDGIYYIKLKATDLPSNPKGTELRAERISRPMVIDNSLPFVKNFQAERKKNELIVTFDVEDATSYIEEVRYLVRPGEWQTVFPVDGICDSKKESFRISIRLLPKSDNMITVKVKDSHHNIGVYQHAF